jgi:hypothetical protein
MTRVCTHGRDSPKNFTLRGAPYPYPKITREDEDPPLELGSRDLLSLWTSKWVGTQKSLSAETAISLPRYSTRPLNIFVRTKQTHSEASHSALLTGGRSASGQVFDCCAPVPIAEFGLPDADGYATSTKSHMMVASLRVPSHGCALYGALRSRWASVLAGQRCGMLWSVDMWNV